MQIVVSLLTTLIYRRLGNQFELRDKELKVLSSNSDE